MLSCFRQRSAAGSTTGAGSSGGGDATSIYSTHLGDVGLTWSRSLLGLSLLVDLTRFSASLKIRPWTYKKRRGSKKTYLLTGSDKVAVEITWDLTRATFSSAFPFPVAGFLVSISVDGDLLLSAGDLKKEHLSTSNPTSRRERARFIKKRGKATYSTAAIFKGRQRKISILLEEREKELGMEVKLEGKKVLEVTRLEWKFRGSERVVIEGGDRILISWDFCRWFSLVKGDADALFVFRFEREEEGEGWEEEEGHIGKKSLGAFSGRSWAWSDSSFGSTVTSSSAGTSSVMEWESLEEADMRRSEGFSLIVLGFKK